MNLRNVDMTNALSSNEPDQYTTMVSSSGGTYMMQKSLVLGYVHPPNDKRVKRNVIALSKSFDVYYQFLGKNPQEAPEDSVHRLPIMRTSSKNPVKAFARWRSFDKTIIKLIEQVKPSLILLNDMPLARPIEIVEAAKSQKACVIIDLHELVPEQRLTQRFSFLWRIYKGGVWKLFSAYLSYADGVIGVSEQQLSEISKKIPMEIPSIVVTNYALERASPLPFCLRKREIAIVGKTSRIFTPNTVELLKMLKRKEFDICVIGGMRQQKELKEIGIINTGFLKYKDMIDRISESLFSFVGFRTNKRKLSLNDKYSAPNKYFDSVAAGTPIIVSRDFEFMSKNVLDNSIGIVLDLGKPDKAALSIMRATQKNSYQALLANISAHQAKYVWDYEKENELIAFVKRICGSKT
ncbi:MAG: Uncharacterized protein XE05_1554 [Thermotogales bacterium 46_20]|nr:MAG: Uncharacterized protein XE05_1554 [Thermotogales bacterium 46_20]